MLKMKISNVQKMDLTDTNWVDWILDTWWDKIFQPQKWKFSEKDPKKLKNITFYLHSTMLLLTGIKLLAVNWCRNWFWATMVFKPIMKTRNVSQRKVHPEKNNLKFKTLFHIFCKIALLKGSMRPFWQANIAGKDCVL